MTQLTGPISGIVVDSNSNSSIKGVQIKFNNVIGITNTKGEFDLRVTYESGSLPSLTFQKSDYQSLEYNPFNGNGTLKSNLVIKLEPSSVSLAKDKDASSTFTQDQINSLTKSKKDFRYFANKKIIDATLNISTRLTPFILTLIAEFGVTGAKEKISKGKTQINDLSSEISCPTNEQLISIINRKNKIVKQLNNSLKTIELASKGIQGNEVIVTTLGGVYTLLKIYPVPTAVGGVGIPISVVNNIQDLKDLIKDNINKFSSTNQNSSSLINLLQGTLITTLESLSILDDLTQHCTSKGTSPASSAPQLAISAELTALTTQQSNQLSPIIINVNGFEMGVETEATTNTLKRRRAIARDKNGVVMLKGEWSFSSIDQILIDELTFYIQQNNLKAE
jgi:prefoldin subunit 5